MEVPGDVRRFIKLSFQAEDWEEALSILGQARTERGAAPTHRLLRCAAFSSRGSLTQLQRLASLLAVDWRDVIVAGEYELRNRTLVHVRDLSRPLQV
jgi:hypothetical protein